ncbi:uncharacterized protein LOC133649038 isoform X2 [Entelurus aequoreus]|uniref:uncharacterized protein LOC133649038 isoform X2 n=1 Tax=Entelurus aequoreus TaxID=161455 RepID=UPI002B1DD241|nr:uncharacterized protein LOC133649038 isoform X2 [Entelurus aequoreus]
MFPDIDHFQQNYTYNKGLVKSGDILPDLSPHLTWKEARLSPWALGNNKESHRGNSTTMAAQLPVHEHAYPSPGVHKLQLLLKVWRLEAARNNLENELRIVTKKAYEDVGDLFMSSFSTSVFNDLSKTLDERCQAIDKLSAFFKDPTQEPRVCLLPFQKNGVRTNHGLPLGLEGILYTTVRRFGPLMQNSIRATSISKAVQALRATQTLQELTESRVAQPPAQVEKISEQNSSVKTINVSFVCKDAEQQAEVNLEDKCQPPAEFDPPALCESSEVITETVPSFNWGQEAFVHVQHKKQTFGQLLHFLRAYSKTVGMLEVSVMEQVSSQLALPTIETQCSPIRQMLHDQIITTTPKTLHADSVDQAPVFRVKRVESDGSLTYACMIATETELWDFGDITTEKAHGKANNSSSDNKDCQRTKCEEDKAGNMKTQTTPYANFDNDNGSSRGPQSNALTIPEFQVRRFEEPEVVVSHIVSPSNFYIQHADSITKLQALVPNCEASSSFGEQNCIPDIRAHVIAWLPKQEQWCRAQVTKICGISEDEVTDGAKSWTSIKVEVKRLDHGDTACVSLCNIKEMSPEMARLPLQSMQVSLANVSPINETDWSNEAVYWFKDMVHNRTFYARLFTQGPGVTVELFLEKGKLGAMRRGPPVSLRLAQNGHAKHSKLKNSGTARKISAKVKLKHKQDAEWEKYLISCYARRIT